MQQFDGPARQARFAGVMTAVSVHVLEHGAAERNMMNCNGDRGKVRVISAVVGAVRETVAAEEAGRRGVLE